MSVSIKTIATASAITSTDKRSNVAILTKENMNLFVEYQKGTESGISLSIEFGISSSTDDFYALASESGAKMHNLTQSGKFLINIPKPEAITYVRVIYKASGGTPTGVVTIKVQ